MINKIKYIILSLLFFTLSCQLSNDLMEGWDEYNRDALLTITVTPGVLAVYNNDAMVITCTPSEPEFTIKYTTDGSDPSRTAGIQYTAPFPIDTASGFAVGSYQIRVVAYDENRISSVVTRTVVLGNGSSGLPYEIATAAQLEAAAICVNTPINTAACFRQVADIDLSSYAAGNGWVPIGDTFDFTGSYDGGNFTISNLTIDRAANNQGLFGTVAGSAALQNINLSDVDVTGGGSTGALAGDVNGTSITISNCNITGTSEVNGVTSVGGLIGYCANATITGCSVTVKVTGTANYTGGFAGYISSTDVTGCNADVEVIGNNYTGGLIGYADGTITKKILRCTSAGSVTGENGVGGLVGITGSNTINGVLIDDSSSAAEVFGTALVFSAGDILGVGGLVGALLYGGEIRDCRAYGDVTNAATHGEIRETGGLVGAVRDANSKITLSYAEGNVNALNAVRVGGFVGFNHNTAIIGTGNYSTGNVTGLDNVGGFVGYNNSTILAGNYATGIVSGRTAVGGFSGWNAMAVTGCWHTTGTITGTGQTIGGFSGNNLAGGIITECYAKGNVIVSGGGSGAGGFVGQTQNGSAIVRSFARGNVTNTSTFSSIGGFAGISAGDITDCYSTGAVQSNGTNYGGFIGSKTTGIITDCYSTGSVTGSGLIFGGFVGNDGGAGSYASCYWRQDTINVGYQDAGAGGAAGEFVSILFQSAAQLKDENIGSGFPNTSGWIFPPWAMSAGGYYPYLNYETTLGDWPQ